MSQLLQFQKMSEGMQDSPSVDKTGIVVGGTLAGLTALTLNQWVAIVTIIYFVMQIFIALPKLIDSLIKMKNKYVGK